MTPTNQMRIVHMVAFADTKWLVCWRNGRWGNTGSQINAAMFSNRKTAEKVADHFDKETVIISHALTFPNLFDGVRP